MKPSTICVLDDEDYELAAAIQKTGIHKNSASILVYLLRRNSGTQRDIQAAARLIQPEVSVHVRILIDRGWIRKDVVRLPRGAPNNVYHLAMSPAEILTAIEAELEEKLSEEQTRVASLVIKLREARKSMEG